MMALFIDVLIPLYLGYLLRPLINAPSPSTYNIRIVTTQLSLLSSPLTLSGTYLNLSGLSHNHTRARPEDTDSDGTLSR